MSLRPQFKRCFRCEVVPPEGVFLLSEKGHFLLQGAAYIQLAPYLNGRYTLEEIIARLQDQITPLELFHALERLRSQGYLAEAETDLPLGQAAFWDMLEIDPATAARRLQETSLAVASFGGIDPASFNDLLASLGIRVSSRGQRCVVLTDDYLQEDLDAFNQEALAQRRPWMLVKPVGVEIWIGPVFVPGQTGCWACLAHRLRGHRKVESYIQEKKKTSAPFTSALVALPTTLQTAFGLAATEAARWMAAGKNERLEGTVVSLNTLTLERRTHALVRRPQCPHCGDPRAFSDGQAAPLKLQSRKKVYVADGGHRIAPPQAVVEKFEHHVSAITGIVRTLRRTDTWEQKRRLVPSYVTDHNFVHMNEDLYFLRESLRGRSGGKGKQDVQARASALCESIERYSGVFQGDEARFKARGRDLDGAAIHPNACMLFSQRQIEERAVWNAKNTRSSWVPASFDEDAQIEWSPVWSLTCREQRYLPTAYCYYGYSRKYNVDFARADSNGCAAGNSKEEAILQGFMELVERDGVALWWYNRLKKPAVDLVSFGDPYVLDLQAYYHTLHRDLWVLDVTSDLAIPVFAALSRRTDTACEDIIFGFGAHFDPQVALLRALTELNQSLPAVFRAPSDEGNGYRYDDREAIAWWQAATLENQPYLAPDASVPVKRQADYPRRSSDDLYADVMTCVRLAEEKGMETLVLDQTRPDTGLDVVKVVVPGLRHFWARFGPGRLYEVPVQMGALKEPLNEEDLNPRLIYF